VKLALRLERFLVDVKFGPARQASNPLRYSTNDSTHRTAIVTTGSAVRRSVITTGGGSPGATPLGTFD